MQKIKFNKYEITLSTLLVLLVVITFSILICNLIGEISITTSTDKIVFLESQPTDITINLNNQTFHSLGENNTYLAYQFIDKENNVVLEKNDAMLITLEPYTQKDFSLSITPPSNFEEYLLKIYLYSDNKLPKYIDLLLCAFNISDSVLSENISINAPLTKFNNVNQLTIPLEIINNSNLPLYNDLNYYISYHIYDKDNNLINWDGNRIQLEKSIYPGESLTQYIYITDLILRNSGTYYLTIDIVHESFSWLSQYYLNCPTIEISNN